jgi:putative redox protein
MSFPSASEKSKARALMEVKVSHVDGVRFAIQARSHVVTSDQPLENGGEDTGMTPPELLLASLGSCAAYYAAEYLRTRNLAETGVEVSVTAEKLLKPARLGNFRIRSARSNSHQKHNEGLVRAVHHCLVHNTLLSPFPEIKIDVTTVGLSNSPVSAGAGLLTPET